MALRIDVHAEPIPGYRLMERIGGGGFGEVWKAEAPGGLHKAIKVIHGDLRSVDADGARHAEQELRALKRLQSIRHPYLLSLERYDVVEGRVLIVTELADCNLWDRFRDCRGQNLPGIPRTELLRYMEEAAEVLDLMNNQYQLQHLDIKPQNLFLVYNHVKVADFGLVKDLEGMRGTITGGVTPVYAAPETFDSVLTRFCDQYSLAIVYQELLTGVRPFNGTSGQQLLMQHIREAPNLGPLPPMDRAAVGRALSKKPEDRFPSCMDFVNALRQSGSDNSAGPVANNHRSPYAETPVAAGNTVPPMPPMPPMSGMMPPPPMSGFGAPMPSHSGMGPMGRSGYPVPQPPMETPKTQLKLRRDDSSMYASAFSASDLVISSKMAPPESYGEGAIIPAIVIGLGHTGLEILGELRREIEQRYGSMERIPTVRTIFIDTDSETLQAASADPRVRMESNDVIPARLNRAAHYLKPRRNGRSLIEGWFDAQMLYRIPRNPATVGLRALGRLAFLDHYRPFAEKFVSTVEACTHADAINQTDRSTQLGLRSNQPRVYVVTNLGGGTGGGMFLDVAYACRLKLRQLGYHEPEIIGVFVVPPADRSTKGIYLANTYTALRELNHYSQPETSFTAYYEEREGQVNDPAAPFARSFIVPMPPAAKPGEPARESAAKRASNFLIGDTLSMVGRTADEVRLRQFGGPQDELSVNIVGQASFTWPKQAVLARTANWLSGSVLSRWITSEPQVIGGYVQGWLTQRWKIEELGAEFLVNRLQQTGEQVLGQKAEMLFNAEAQPFATRGWFARDPDPAKLWQAISRLQQLVGMPDERAMQRTVGTLEHKLNAAADVLTAEYAPKITRLATTLLEHPDYRLVGAEEVVRQVNATIDGILQQYEPMSMNLSAQAMDSFYRIHAYLNAERGQKAPKLEEVVECLKTYPTWRYQSLILRQVCRIYQTIKTHLVDQMRELGFCRQRLEEILAGFKRDRRDEFPANDRLLLPPGVTSLEAALKTMQSSITPDDVRSFDKKLQTHIEKEFNALFNACVSSMNMLGNLQNAIEVQAKVFLTPRLGSANLVQMFFARFPDMNAATQAMRWLNDQAAPPLKPSGPMTQTVILAGPDGEAAAHIQQLGQYALQPRPTHYLPNADEILIYREYTQVPLTDLPQLGTLGEDAYHALMGSQHGSPHIRCDVANWQEVEAY